MLTTRTKQVALLLALVISMSVALTSITTPFAAAKEVSDSSAAHKRHAFEGATTHNNSIPLVPTKPAPPTKPIPTKPVPPPPPIREECKYFTTTIKFLEDFTLGDLVSAPLILPEDRKYLDVVLIEGYTAYAQLHGNWCFDTTNNTVTSYYIQYLDMNITDEAKHILPPLRVVFKDQSPLRPRDGDLRAYNIATPAQLYFDNPETFSAPIPKTDLEFKVKPGRHLLTTLKANTLLNGDGSASCFSSTRNVCQVTVSDM